MEQVAADGQGRCESPSAASCATLGGRAACPEGEGPGLAPWLMSQGDKTDGDS